LSRDDSVPGWIDPVFRIATAAVTAWFAYRIIKAYQAEPSRLILIIVLISELISLITIILSRKPTIRDANPAYALLTIIASFIVPLFVSVDRQAAFIPERIGEIVSLLGLTWTIYAKISLGRSFGLLAAKRVVKVRGAYRFVRHPIYIGYFVVDMAFLFANFNKINLIVFGSLYCMQVLRALREEQILSSDEAYRAYCKRTRYRFIYGLF
jgi:protein-S-isoprenylcysteine O-methyltransferase Ste14